MPVAGPVVVVGPVRLEPQARSEGLAVAGVGTYRGTIEVRRTGEALAVVDDLPLEDYVRGIEEVPPNWPAAALQAQAIAARTYAANKAVTGDARWRAVGADICATPTCQVYRGLDAERRAAGSGWLAAVEATAGRALLAGGTPILASYSSTANGPRAMSQIGALAMANEGRSAADILFSYYGLRPTVAASGMPETIRVALVLRTAAVRVTATGPFRVLDGTGAEVATATSGDWRFEPAGDGVRVIPPDTYRYEATAAAPVTALAPAPPRIPARALTAATTPPPGRAAWAMTALALALASGTSGIALLRRRRT